MPEDIEDDPTLQTLAMHHDIMSKIRTVQRTTQLVIARPNAFSREALLGLVMMQSEIVDLLALGGELITETTPEQNEALQDLLRTLQNK